MKKFINSLFILATLLFLAAPFFAIAQDTAIVSGAISPDAGLISRTSEFIINPPQWFISAIIITGALLSATQTILKQIPTERSVKIGGLIGKMLDVLTWFSKDNKKGGGTHS